MNRIPFDKNEMHVTHTIKNRPIMQSPIPIGNNLLLAFQHKDPLFLAYTADTAGTNTRSIPDNIACSLVKDGQGDYSYDQENGQPDTFGALWIRDSLTGGAIEKPGAPHLLSDMSEAPEKLVFPNPRDWNWEGNAKRDADYLASVSDMPLVASIFCGFFERMISWLGFENAAVALIDDDQKEHVHWAFSNLVTMYKSFIDCYVEFYHIDIIKLHDDWGAQRSPFFSKDTLDEMIIPYIKQLVDYAHEKGLPFEMHSCGKIEPFVESMVYAGCDAWMGQDVNDKLPLVQKWGDKITIEVEAPALGLDATDEELQKAAKAFCDEWIIPGKPIVFSAYFNQRPNRPEFYEALYEHSRKTYCE